MSRLLSWRSAEGGAVMESLTSERRAEIDALILAKAIIAAQKRIMEMCEVGLREARVLFRAR